MTINEMNHACIKMAETLAECYDIRADVICKDDLQREETKLLRLKAEQLRNKARPWKQENRWNQ